MHWVDAVKNAKPSGVVENAAQQVLDMLECCSAEVALVCDLRQEAFTVCGAEFPHTHVSTSRFEVPIPHISVTP